MTKLQDRAFRYTVTRWLHGISAAIFFLLLLFSSYLYNNVDNADERQLVFTLHVSTGLISILLYALRISWLAFYREERTFFNNDWQRTAAHLNHFLLYTIMLLLPLSGIIFVMAGGKEIPFFELFSIKPLDWLDNREIKYYAKETHRWLVKIVYVILLMHISASVGHKLGLFGKH